MKSDIVCLLNFHTPSSRMYLCRSQIQTLNKFDSCSNHWFLWDDFASVQMRDCERKRETKNTEKKSNEYTRYTFTVYVVKHPRLGCKNKTAVMSLIYVLCSITFYFHLIGVIVVLVREVALIKRWFTAVAVMCVVSGADLMQLPGNKLTFSRVLYIMMSCGD